MLGTLSSTEGDDNVESNDPVATPIAQMDLFKGNAKRTKTHTKR